MYFVKSRRYGVVYFTGVVQVTGQNISNFHDVLKNNYMQSNKWDIAAINTFQLKTGKRLKSKLKLKLNFKLKVKVRKEKNYSNAVGMKTCECYPDSFNSDY